MEENATKDLPIEASTKIAALLDRYPELEDALIAIAPPFAKLRNPFLRRSVAKVASLRQAAAVANMPVVTLVNKLRTIVGQDLIEDAAAENPANAYLAERPEWFDEARVVGSVRDEEQSDAQLMPLVHVFEQASKLRDGEILELVTSHLPAPGIDIMKERGYLVWSVERGSCIHTYFRKAGR